MPSTHLHTPFHTAIAGLTQLKLEISIPHFKVGLIHSKRRKYKLRKKIMGNRSGGDQNR